MMDDGESPIKRFLVERPNPKLKKKSSVGVKFHFPVVHGRGAAMGGNGESTAPATVVEGRGGFAAYYKLGLYALMRTFGGYGVPGVFGGIGVFGAYFGGGLREGVREPREPHPAPPDP
jgi:hypothetical protein